MRRPPRFPTVPGVVPTLLRPLWSEPRVPEPGGTPWWDEALVAVLVPVAVAEGVLRDDVAFRPLTTLLALVCVATIWFRRSHPLAAVVVAFGAQTAAGVVPELAGQTQAVLDVTACVLLLPYSLLRWGSGRDATLGIAFVLACHFVREPFVYDAPVGEIVVGAGFLLFPAALGAAVRFATNARRREVDQVRTLEREQLARELHDTVAHHVSAIVIQAQAGRAVAAKDPARAVEVLEVVEAEASRSLAEMRELVGILRTADDAELVPQGGIVDLERLATDPAGRWEVHVERIGDLDRVGVAVEAAVYRLVQESLTNVARHARDVGQVWVTVTGDDEQVEVTVVDDGRQPARAAGEGFGLVGMAERVGLLGGTFAAGPTPARDGWSVRAAIPRGEQR